MSGVRGSSPVATNASMSRAMAGLCIVVLTLGVSADPLTGQAMDEAIFPHAAHEGLFPVCTGCHADLGAGTVAGTYPPATQCVGCHDGAERPTVEWTGVPSSRTSNVVFDHGSHPTQLQSRGDEAVDCSGCHVAPGGGVMDVEGRGESEACWGCHAHERPDHYSPTPAGAEAYATCETCHVPANAGLPIEIRPSGHEGRDFLLEVHGAELEAEVGRCATCHTVERCAACHVDASAPAFDGLPSSPRQVDGWRHEYPEPDSHRVPGFKDAHVPDASVPAAECSTCHTSDDCLSCHVEPAPDMVSALPRRVESAAPGVHLEVVRPDSHDAFLFPDAHAAVAAASPNECASCHTETYCTQCHDSQVGGSYHEADFLARHPAQAWARSTDCAGCHQTAVFCRGCHVESGLGSEGRLGAGYHDAEPLFLLRHGEPARQSLESCASCHEQTDCVQCHAVTGAFQVSPHRPGFDAQAAWARSPRTCLACHVGNPIGGGR